ncbi:hypothetical protein L6452_34471 [Arctium lappa]|uniref:Uncharacterized protein n=1 Tax=Arctium lappa TaxID=4217 RepID=A0ACB8YJB4_ARCLA|nr:hypothetical protein L6452_34471 [Arctium lappa]
MNETDYLGHLFFSHPKARFRINTFASFSPFHSTPSNQSFIIIFIFIFNLCYGSFFNLILEIKWILGKSSYLQTPGQRLLLPLMKSAKIIISNSCKWKTETLLRF